MDKTSSGVEDKAWTRRLISHGFPRAPGNIDAAFVWTGNGRIYFIKGLQSSIVFLPGPHTVSEVAQGAIYFNLSQQQSFCQCLT